MRAFFSQTLATTRPSINGAWFPGLPHVLAALVAWPMFGTAACVSGLLMTSLVTFVVWLPMTALALNNGQALAESDAAPVLTSNAKRVLFVAWTATAWLAAAIAR